MITRRRMLIGGVSTVVGASALIQRGLADAQQTPPGQADGPPSQLVVPNGSLLPWRRVAGDVKVFHLVAQPVQHEVVPGLRIEAWGYNGSTPGPTIEATEGDRVRIYVTNRLPEPTTVHWHGVFLPSGMDGVAGLDQRAIEPGHTARYEFTLRNAGTFMYHPHYDEMTQIALGMTGMFVVHPRRARTPHVDRDFGILLGEWTIDAGTRRPNPLAMNDFNVLTMNGKSFPATAPLVVRRGQRVRIRFGNLGPMDHHPIHLHGNAFKVTATDGGLIPDGAQWPETTVLVPVGSTRDVEFVADAPGDWAMHCHMTHHGMTQMGHAGPPMVGVDAARVDTRVQRVLPDYMTMGQQGMGGMGDMGMPVPENSVPMRGGPGPFGNIEMGGMFTLVKVREGITTYADPGWFTNPEGTVVRDATEAELRADHVEG